MSRFKAGDLALIIDAKCHQNIGRTVTLESRHIADRIEINGTWWLAHKGSPAWVIKGDLTSVKLPKTDTGFIAESCLMPLSGDFTPEQSKEQERPVNA